MSQASLETQWSESPGGGAVIHMQGSPLWHHTTSLLFKTYISTSSHQLREIWSGFSLKKKGGVQNGNRIRHLFGSEPFQRQRAPEQQERRLHTPFPRAPLRVSASSCHTFDCVYDLPGFVSMSLAPLAAGYVLSSQKSLRGYSGRSGNARKFFHVN